MKTDLDCFSCFIRIGLQCAELSGANESEQNQLMVETLSHLKENLDEFSPPMIVERIQQSICEQTGCSDPYKQLKLECNETAIAWLPQLRGLLRNESDLQTALKVAVLGNIMDYGAFDAFDVDSLVITMPQRVFSIDQTQAFEAKLQDAKTLTYFADNAGEICFDGLLIEYLVRHYALEKIYLVVRREPFLNDVAFEDEIPRSIRDLEAVEVCRLPVVAAKQDQDLWGLLSAADIVLAKGMANFESYSEEASFYFLLISKCQLVSQMLTERSGESVEIGDWIFYQKEPRESDEM